MTMDLSQPSTDRLALLYRLSQTFSSSLDLDEVLNLVMDEVIAVTRAERGFVMLHDAGEGLAFRVARGMDRSTIDDPQFQISRSVVERVAREGQPILTSDAQRDDRFSMRQSVMSLGLRSILCVPLTHKGQVLGAVYVDNRLQSGIFVQDDLDLLMAIASSAAVAIENARLYQVAVEKGRLERELQMARELQASLLPGETPQTAGWEFAARWRPAHQVSGDFYDFIALDRGRAGVVVADVSGKGMPAALFMALSRSIIRASVNGAPSPVEGMARANRLICADSSGGMFVTVFYAMLDPEAGTCTYVNAGHNPPLLYQGGPGAEVRATKLMPTGMALGILPDAPLEERTVPLQGGDFLLIYTDGVPDATNVEEEHFEMERLHEVMAENRGSTAGGLATALEGALEAFCGPALQFDDIAFLVARRQGAEGR